jgi:glycosyltransferase involved in cell wall biosynthesis
MAKDSLTVILPAYNEAGNIKNVVSGVVFYMRKNVEDFEVIVVDDGSTDGTPGVLGQINGIFPELRFFSHEKNSGYGSAIRTGIRLSEKNRIFIMDSDGQFQIGDFKKFWDNREYYDFIIGYRHSRKDNWYRLCLGGLGSFLANLFLKRSLKDVNCGFKLFKAQELKGIPLVSSGGCISFEILFRLLKSGKNNILQLPVEHSRRKMGSQTGGKLKIVFNSIRQGFNIIWDEKTNKF